ncbi:hypothetical protein M413DRAFT_116430 [Hebeloma cylindrosporum]|uniref:Uncharacterized protein n=1 Tax=Hebeloma cylindrosporum TaxID=76867 RepID=A0A0C3D057_HEBCY|nr:hypothetical protein M413DRAFT_116430 [Hebeloma cylindrosporum h7]
MDAVGTWNGGGLHEGDPGSWKPTRMRPRGGSRQRRRYRHGDQQAGSEQWEAHQA